MFLPDFCIVHLTSVVEENCLVLFLQKWYFINKIHTNKTNNVIVFYMYVSYNWLLSNNLHGKFRL